MTRGWILDTGAVFRAADRETVVALLPAAHQQGHRIVVPQHVLLELARQLMVKLAKDQRRAGVARDVDPAQVFQDVREQLEGVEVLPFEQEDAVALLGWLESEAFRVAEHGQPPRPGLVWEHIKLAKAARDGGPPIRKAVRDLPCPSCGNPIRSCACATGILKHESEWSAVLDSAARHAGNFVDKKHASATIDWLTVAMAVRHNLMPVSSENRGRGSEWESLTWIQPTDLKNKILGAA